MSKLFSPCCLGPLSLRNAFIFLPFFTSYADENGLVTTAQIRYYRRMAASGVGLVVVEASGLRNSASRHVIHAFDANHQHGLKKLAEAIQAEGAKAVLQICHPGRFAFVPGCLAPSAVPPFGNNDLMPKAMTEKDMELVISDFAESANIAMQAGFDGVELHGATGYLLASFLSPQTNRRTDQYGGSLENRVRFPLQVLDAIREKVGNYPIGYRFMAREYREGGLSLQEGADAAKLLSTAHNLAYLSVSAGTHECFALLAQQKEKVQEGFMLPEAQAVKTAVSNVAVIGAGHMQCKEICERALNDGLSDAIGLGRVLYADDDWLRKISGKMTEPIQNCVLCGTCVKQVQAGKLVFCNRWSKEKKAEILQGLSMERL